MSSIHPSGENAPSADGRGQGVATVVHDFVAAINARDVDALDLLVADDYHQHDGTIPHGRATLKSYIEAMYERWPVVRIELEHVLSDEHRVSAFTRIIATPELVIRAANVWLIADGRLSEHWEIADASESLNTLSDVRRTAGRPAGDG